MRSKFFRNQVKMLLQKNTSILVFLILCGFVLMHFAENVLRYRGSDVLEMYHPMNLLILTYADNTLGRILITWYPVLLVIPAGFAFIDDRRSGIKVFWISKIGKTPYYLLKGLAGALVTFLVFTVPLLLEVILNAISFPSGATGSVNGSELSENYMPVVSDYMFSDIYIWNRYVYAVLFILLAGSAVGIFAMFTMALSACLRIRFRILLFLPVYVILNAAYYVESYLMLPVETDYIVYFDMDSSAVRSEAGYILVLLFFALLSTVLLICGSRRDLVSQ